MSTVADVDMTQPVRSSNTNLIALRIIGCTAEYPLPLFRLHTPYRPVVPNLGSIEPQGFGESVSGVRRSGSPRTNTVCSYINCLSNPRIPMFFEGQVLIPVYWWNLG